MIYIHPFIIFPAEVHGLPIRHCTVVFDLRLLLLLLFPSEMPRRNLVESNKTFVPCPSLALRPALETVSDEAQAT